MSHKRFLSLLYLRNFLIIFGAFCAFYTFVDILLNHKNLVINSNIFLLYIFFTLTAAAFFVLPACIMLAMFLSSAQLINRNEFIALRSLGLSFRAICAPFLAVALLMCAIFCALGASNAAYFAEYKDSILKTGLLASKSKNIMLFKDEKIIFASSFKDKKLQDVLILDLDNHLLKSLIVAPLASYLKDNFWQVKNAKVYDFASLPQNLDAANTPKSQVKLEQNELAALSKEQIIALKNELENPDFSPALQSFRAEQKGDFRVDLGIKEEAFLHHRADDLSLKDALSLLSELEYSAPLRTSIYKYSIFFFFAPFLGVALLRLLPQFVRYSELSVHLLLAIFIALVVFGCLNLSLRFAANGAISPEMGILVPNLFVIFSSLIIWLKGDK